MTEFTDSSRIDLDFTDFFADTIAGSARDTVYIVADLLNETNVREFRVSVDSSRDIRVRDELNQELLIADSSGQRVDFLGILSELSVVMENSSETTFFVYPNPFGRFNKTETHFVYYLNQAENFEINIYTLTGDWVRNWSFTQSEHPQLTQAGLHQAEWSWDGTNGMNEPVLNGVYLAVLVTESGQRAMTKIAVVR
ncbi:MAG: T9SS type A sorting domain-containing protein [candidate division KSB1 bacterium]|nr:T9SS type A sorting domain-containing protein [candidate division KSB1 bacterium]